MLLSELTELTELTELSRVCSAKFKILIISLLISLSWNAISKEALDKTTPVNPPIVNKNKNPRANIKAVVGLDDPP